MVDLHRFTEPLKIEENDRPRPHLSTHKERVLFGLAVFDSEMMRVFVSLVVCSVHRQSSRIVVRFVVSFWHDDDGCSGFITRAKNPTSVVLRLCSLAVNSRTHFIL